MNKKLAALGFALFFSFSGIALAEEPGTDEEDPIESAVTTLTLGQKIRSLNQEKIRIQKEFAKERSVLNRKLGALLLELLRSDRAAKEQKQKERVELLEEREALEDAYKIEREALTLQIKTRIDEFLSTKEK